MKKTTIFLTILLAVFFTSTLYLLYLNFNKPSTITSTSTPTTGIIPTDTINPTADWKTYSDSNYGINFSYPQDWKVESGSNYLRVSQIEPVQNLIIAIDFKETTLSIEDLINNFEKADTVFKQINPNLKPENILINGINAKKVEYTDGTGLENVSIIVSDNSHKILIEHRFPSDNIINQILSTFQFTDTAATATQLSPQIGYIKNIYTQNSKHYIDIDYIQWINDNSLPNGFKIVNDNSLIRTLEVSQQAVITLIDWTDKGMTNPKISFDEFIRVFKQTSPEFNISNFTTQPFDITFDKDGLVNKVSLRYTP